MGSGQIRASPADIERASLRHIPLNPRTRLRDKIADLERCLDDVKSALHLATLAEPVSQPFRIDGEKVRRILAARRIRERQLGAELFADPSWDLLLEAFAADLEHKPIVRTELCRAAPVPETTAMRWLNKLEQDGWLRSSDANAGQPQTIEMTLEGSTKLLRYFECVGPGFLLT